ncbi:uncharacterized protein LOC117110702 [Anneissia japonica]|uniref:uncharacterized protein LOC117110702 n=1 Tax=Anneissia japonica TaxID=1529436 RepID=UPI001425851E|nr:uncharacterized protein LOC117110702 [Anneissia japonica]
MKFASVVAVLIFVVTGTLSDDCPDDYKFKYCPRLDDSPSATVCCRINDQDSCCTQSFKIWLIIVVSVSIVGFLVFVGLICCCCITGCYFFEQRKRKDYIWVRSDPYGKNLSYQQT